PDAGEPASEKLRQADSAGLANGACLGSYVFAEPAPSRGQALLQDREGRFCELCLGKAMKSEMPLDYFGDAHQVAVERALSEFRAARPVAIRSGGAFALACPAEGLTEKQISFLQAAGRNARLIV